MDINSCDVGLKIDSYDVGLLLGLIKDYWTDITIVGNRRVDDEHLERVKILKWKLERAKEGELND